MPPILVFLVNKMRGDCADVLFDGDDALFKAEALKVDVYGEYGCGKSTKWVLINTRANVIAVDTSGEWVDVVKNDIKAQISRSNIHHSNLGVVGEWGYPSSYEKMDYFSD